ncbi:uncharacterized protein LOC105692564 [Athalia rosae]|uniref:uncharacterized protein LOC105692564 n=1 Tax=Athalia rosae TaxID=37344 RepID=UPI00203429A6|nr:uncharacterized protein LOC105692564 [Athalia rosae]
MNPSGPRSSRSSVQSLAQSPTPTISPSPSPSPSPSLTLPLAHQQQQLQPQILYGPITALQPNFTTALHTPCIYSSARSVAGASGSATLQGKNAKWQGKCKASRSNQQFHGQPAQSGHISYTGKPLVLYDQTQSGTPASTSSFLVSSSTFAHGQFPPEPYGAPSVAVVPPQYFKPPEVQTFCLVQDRQQPPQHNSYYNISATNTCSLQAVNSTPGFQLSNIAPYAVAAFPNNQLTPPSVPVQSAQIFQTAPLGLVFGPPPREKHNNTSNLDVSSSAKCLRSRVPVASGSPKIPAISHLRQNNEWPPPIVGTATSTPSAIGGCSGNAALSSGSAVFDNCKSPQGDPEKKSCSSSALKLPDDRYSDESSASFDFAIEAEKMVSALCNTASSNDLGGASSREETRKTETNYFNGAGDNVANKGDWIADYAMEYSPRTVGDSRNAETQTQPNQGFTQQLPELIRKTAYWGCTEAENVLNAVKHQDPKQAWLSNVSSATRTAITKSSTCFPIFSGDRAFVCDMINALLRITNGWLVLDNYLNKQHYPNLIDKYDPELARGFQEWEGSTHELLRNVIQTFLKLDEANATSGSQNDSQNGSFPGDVSLYTNADIFCPYQQSGCQNRSDGNFLPSVSSLQQTQESAFGVHYAPQSTGAQNIRYFNTQLSNKETKLRSKWTITESLATAIDGTCKSVSDMSTSHGEAGFGASKFRAKSNSSSSKSLSRQSLNAEFFDLRNKVMESNSTDVGKQWNTNADSRGKSEVLFGTKISKGVEPVYDANSSYFAKSHDVTYDVTGIAKPYLQGIDSIFHNETPGVAPSRFEKNSIGGESNLFGKSRVNTNYRNKPLKNGDQNYAVKLSRNSNDSSGLGKLTNDQREMAAVPRTKMTLLSQIEPSPSSGKKPEEMAANLTAWFASMRTSNPILTTCSIGGSDNRLSESFRSLHSQGLSRSTIDLTRQLYMDPNRQLQTIQNMQSIQSAPWNACNLINNRNHNVQQVEEYDSSEDVRVYMKPGSYNVPKKRHQKRANRRSDSQSLSKNPSNGVTQNNHPVKDKLDNFGSATTMGFPFPGNSSTLENSPRLIESAIAPSSQEFPQDITWKAACASAEILLEALNVKEGESGLIEVKGITAQVNQKVKCEGDGASSYEASEDDSGSTGKLSSSGLQSKEGKVNKTNVKTDSWLIRTLNNASIKQRQEPDMDSSESFNSSIHEDELTTENSIEKLDSTLGHSEEPRDEDQTGDLTEGNACRATYSETVRRCASGNGSKEPCRSRPQKLTLGSICATGNSIPTRKSQRKESERPFLSHKSRKSIGKKIAKDADAQGQQNEESSSKGKVAKEDTTRLPASKGHGKKKDGGNTNSGEHGKNKSGDRGWSVWYSSRRRQSLSPMASRKLETIHQTIWGLKEAEMFKYPPSNSTMTNNSSESIVDYYKVIKSPMFLETIGYKLKNNIYHKVEHVIRDFRKIIFNSKMYHKHDLECMAQVETLSKKLDTLFDEHFANWDFENITGSPRDGNGSPIPPRYKLPVQKSQRSVNTKKSPSVSTTTAEN